MSLPELTPAQHEQVAELFALVIDLPATERAAILARSDAEPAVKQTVEALLAEPTAPVLEDANLEGVTEQLLEARPEWIGPFRILDVLGEGGMGTVYRAEQLEPVKRDVAVKVIRFGAGSPQVLARFEAERQALAVMDHPYIARVFDGGATDSGEPYFVMELVPGEPLTAFCDAHRLTIEQRLELFAKVCRAVHHAHQKGVIHRDLKPNNVMVSEHGGDHLPKVIDFGVAKATESPLTKRNLVTEVETLVGTPQYMAPEQIAGRDIDVRADVYALGVMLYELLVGVLPFDFENDEERGDYHKLLGQIRERDPVKPSTQVSTVGERASRIAEQRLVDARKLHGLLRGDLDWIVIRALEKDRERRYGSAAEFADDVLRHLRDEPVIARPPSRGYRIAKLVRRNRKLVAASAVAVLALVGGGVASALGWSEALRANGALNDALKDVEQQLTRADQVKRVLVDALNSIDPAVSMGLSTDLLMLILQNTSERLAKETIEDPLIRAELRHVIGKTLARIEAPADSLEQLDRALADLQNEPLNPLRLQIEVDRVSALEMSSRFDDVRQVEAELLPRLRTVFGPNSLLEVRLRSLRTMAEKADGKIRVAEEVVEPLLAALPGLEQRELSLAIHLRQVAATVWMDSGRMDRALPMLFELVSICQEHCGTDHLNTIHTKSMLVEALRMAGRDGDAGGLAEQIHASCVRLLGKNHDQTKLALGRLATFWVGGERNGEAIAALQGLLDTVEWPESDLRRLSVMNALGGAHALAGNLPDAIAILQETLKRLAEGPGATGEMSLSIRNNLVNLLTVAERFDEAIDTGNELLPVLQERFGAGSAPVLETRSQILQAMAYGDRTAEALEGARELLPDVLRVFGPLSQEATFSSNILKYAAQAENQETGLLEIERAALEESLAKAADPEASVTTLIDAATQLLAHPRESLRDAERGERLADRAIESIDDASATAQLIQIGDALQKGGRSAAAKRTFERALERASAGDPMHPLLEQRLEEIDDDR